MGRSTVRFGGFPGDFWREIGFGGNRSLLQGSHGAGSGEGALISPERKPLGERRPPGTQCALLQAANNIIISRLSCLVVSCAILMRTASGITFKRHVAVGTTIDAAARLIVQPTDAINESSSEPRYLSECFDTLVCHAAGGH